MNWTVHCSVWCLNLNVVKLLSFTEHVENTLSKVNSKFMTPAFDFTHRPTGLLPDYLCFWLEKTCYEQCRIQSSLILFVWWTQEGIFSTICRSDICHMFGMFTFLRWQSVKQLKMNHSGGSLSLTLTQFPYDLLYESPVTTTFSWRTSAEHMILWWWIITFMANISKDSLHH